MSIRNPIEWSLEQLRLTNTAVSTASSAVYGHHEADRAAPAVIRQISAADLKDALAKGVEDFGVFRTDVIFLCMIYPMIGLLLGRLAFGSGLMPMVFPLASGFALVGPVAAFGVMEMSRRRELDHAVGWPDAVSVVRSPAFGAIVGLGLVLVALYTLWLIAASMIYSATLGPEAPASLSAFMNDVFTTRRGWTMIGVGMGVGFLFAVLALAISVVSFPMMLDREVSLEKAIGTSVRAVAANPMTMALWGLIVAAGLVLGSIPLFLGLIVVLPILGHATWHLYRKVIM